MTKTKLFLWFFMIFLFAELIMVSSADWYLYRIFTKPLIVGSLLVFILAQEIESKSKVLVSLALLSTLIGDIQFIYAGDYSSFFIGGVAAYFVANVIYIFQFARHRNKEIGYIIPSSILLLYGGSLFWYLCDSLGDFLIPVAIYMTSAWLMILFAYLRKDDITDNGYIYVLTGTLLLMLSASIVAITRFKSDIPYSRVLVMAVHGLSQLCLVMGILLSDPFYKRKNTSATKSLKNYSDH